MLFNSQPFILLFLPITFLAFLFFWSKLGQTPALLWLVVASFFFYGWWNPVYAPLLAGSVLANFLVARGMVHAPRKSRRRRTLLTLGIAFNLTLLGYFKYSGWLVGELGGITGAEYLK